MFRQNPVVIDFSKIPDESLEIAKAIFKADGTLYRTKPKKEGVTGDCKYVWREVAFHISTNPQHHCMPVTSCFDLETYDENGKWSSRLASIREQELKVHIKNILNAVPLKDQPGTRRWLKALGQI